MSFSLTRLCAMCGSLAVPIVGLVLLLVWIGRAF